MSSHATNYSTTTIFNGTSTTVVTLIDNYNWYMLVGSGFLANQTLVREGNNGGGVGSADTTGNNNTVGGGAIFQYSSSNLTAWTYEGIFFQVNSTSPPVLPQNDTTPVDPLDLDEMWECPDLFPLKVSPSLSLRFRGFFSILVVS